MKKLFLSLFLISTCLGQSFRVYIENAILYNVRVEEYAKNIYRVEYFDFDVSIQALNEPVIITSYQFALRYNSLFRAGGILDFKYLEGSSDLSVYPSAAIGWNTKESPRFTFASFPGYVIVPTYKKKLGRFRVTNSKRFAKVEDIGITPFFEGTVTTIITGERFANITEDGIYDTLHTYKNKLYILPTRVIRRD